MADRGGLNYEIKVQDGFSANLKSFKAQADQARSAWGAFKRNFSGLTQQARSVERSLQRITTALRRSSTALTRFGSVADGSGLGRLITALDRLSVAQAKVSVTARRASDAARGLNREARGAARATQAEATAINRAGAAASRASNRVNRLGGATRRAATGARGLLFTFRRLVGALAVFQGARLALNFFTDFIRKTGEFSSNLENARLGLAALFTTVGEVTDANGKLLQGQEALNEALRVSDDQLKKLRIEGLKTAATFDQLAETFQVGVAPGLEAGLDLDEVRKVTVQISQAAAAINVPQNQLTEEIRSLLAGNIQARTTQIATRLSISNADIRKAKEAGNLFEFLQERFNGFSIAGERALDTFSARASNALDAILLLSSTAATGAFESIKQGLADIAQGAVTIDESTQSLQINPAALAVFQELFAGIESAIGSFRQLGETIPLRDLQKVAAAIGGIIALLAGALGPAVQGVVAGIADLVTLTSFLLAAFQEVAGISLSVFGDASTDAAALLALLVEIGVVVGGLKLALTAVVALFSTALGPVLVIVGSLALIKSLVDEAVKSLTGFENVDYSAGIVILSKELEVAVERFGILMTRELDLIAARSALLFARQGNAVGLVSDSSLKVLEAGIKATEAVYAAADKNAVQRLEKFREEVRKARTEGGNLSPAGVQLAQTDAIGTQLAKPFEELGKFMEKSFDDLISKVPALKSALGGADGPLASVAGKARLLEASLKASEKALKGIASESNKLTQEIEKLTNANEISVAQASGGGNVQAIKRRQEADSQAAAERKIQLAIRAQVAERTKAEGVNKQLATQAQKQIDALTEQQRLLFKRNELTLKQLDLQAQLTEQQRVESQLTGNNSGGVGVEGTLERTQALASGTSAGFQALSVQIFDALLLSEQESGEAIDSYSDFFDSLGDLVDDFFASLSAKEALFGLLKGLLTGGVGFPGTGSPGGTVAPSGGAAGGASTGFAEGGFVSPSLAFNGGAPPPGVSPRDTVSANLEPGEVVQRKAAVSTYGRDFLLALNDRMIDPFLTQALMGARPRRSSTARVPKRGYASGGEVAASPTASSPAGPGQAVVMSDPQAAERFFNGGRPAIVRWLRNEGFTQR